MASAQNPPTAVELCCGCGGATLGMEYAGLDVQAAFDIGHHQGQTLRENHLGGALRESCFRESSPHSYHDVNDIGVSYLDDKDIQYFFAGPPCQPFSTSGENDPDDPRRQIIFSVIEWIKELRPMAGAIENVPGLKKNHPDVLNELLDDLRDSGYHVGAVVLNSADYMVPQKRERMFLMFSREDCSKPDTWTPPKDRSSDSEQFRFGEQSVGLSGYKTAGEALDGLPKPLPPQKPREDSVHTTLQNNDHYVTRKSISRWMSASEYHGDVDNVSWAFRDTSGESVKMPTNHVAANHRDSTREKYSEWGLGYCGSTTTSRRLDPDEPSPTITVSQGTPPVHYVGKNPENDESVEDVRRLTVREVARLQSFPDEWVFTGTKQQQFQQVGNAVPPLLSQSIAQHLNKNVIQPSLE